MDTAPRAAASPQSTRTRAHRLPRHAVCMTVGAVASEACPWMFCKLKITNISEPGARTCIPRMRARTPCSRLHRRGHRLQLRDRQLDVHPLRPTRAEECHALVLPGRAARQPALARRRAVRRQVRHEWTRIIYMRPLLPPHAAAHSFRMWCAAILGCRSRVNSPFMLRPPARMCICVERKSVRFQKWTPKSHGCAPSSDA